ncbi:MAG: hypothetical protein Q7T79_01535, partial [bacterium]|nr:hypothetical protein [bacterium]
MTSGAGASRDAAVVHGGGFPACGFVAAITRCSRADMAAGFASSFGAIVASGAGASRDAAVVHSGGFPACGFMATIARCSRADVARRFT